MRKQTGIPWMDKDYSFIDFFRKSYNCDHDSERKEITFHGIRDSEIRREYHIGSIKQINHAIQYDEKPNRRLEEPQCEIYKITINFTPISKCLTVRRSITDEEGYLKFSCERLLYNVETKRRKHTFSK